MRLVLALAVLACALGSWLLPCPASAVCTTLDVTTPQGSKRADLRLTSREAFDFFDVSGTLDVDLNLGSSPLESTLEITGADLLLTDMTFDFGPTIGYIAVWDLHATMTTSVLSAVAFDGVDTYSFDLTGADFAIVSGMAQIVDLVNLHESTGYLSADPWSLNSIRVRSPSSR